MIRVVFGLDDETKYNHKKYPFEKIISMLSVTFEVTLPEGFFSWLIDNTTLILLFVNESDNKENFLIGGTLSVWRENIIRFSSTKSQRGLRFLFNRISDWFVSQGINLIPDYYKSDNQDGTFILRVK